MKSTLATLLALGCLTAHADTFSRPSTPVRDRHASDKTQAEEADEGGTSARDQTANKRSVGTNPETKKHPMTTTPGGVPSNQPVVAP